MLETIRFDETNCFPIPKGKESSNRSSEESYYAMKTKLEPDHSTIDVLWGQPIKLIQAVSTSEFHEY